MSRAFMILEIMLCYIFVEATSNSGSDITQALQNINEMENDLMRFYRQWDSLSSAMARRGIKKALESCAKDHESLCTPEKRTALSKCISNESKTIHDAVVVIYDDKIRNPWKMEFEGLRRILENPEHHVSEIQNAIWTVHQETFSEKSVRGRFYTSLVNFQLPNVAPGLYPLDKVYQLCLKQQFPPNL